MDDFPTKVADALESVVTKIRVVTVDRLARIAKWVALGLILFVVAIVAVVLILIGSTRLLGEVVGTEWAYAILGGLFLLLGALLWKMRNPKERDTS